MNIMYIKGKVGLISKTIAFEFTDNNIKSNDYFIKRHWNLKDSAIILTKYGQIFRINKGDVLIKTSCVDKFTKMNEKEFSKNIIVLEVVD